MGRGWFVLAAFLMVLAQCASQRPSAPGPDRTPPGRVTDLHVIAIAESTLTLAWTSPGGDGEAGTAARYDIRMSSVPFTPERWGECQQLSPPPHPKPGDTPDTLLVHGLRPATIHYVALKAADQDSNWSQISNVAREVTNGVIRLAGPIPWGRPVWSPDGDRMAYLEGNSIAIVPSGGGEPIRIFGGNAIGASWSPSGSQFVFAWRSSLWLIPSTGGTAEEISIPGIWAPYSPAWSPDGTEIAVVVGDIGRSVVVVPVTGGQMKSIAVGFINPDAPAWSPDGTSIIYSGENQEGKGIWVSPSQGGQRLRLYSGRAQSPVFSPDGRKIAFVAFSDNGSEIRVMPSGGGEFVQVDIPDSLAARDPQWVAWSPDGTRLAFATFSHKLGGTLWAMAVRTAQSGQLDKASW